MEYTSPSGQQSESKDGISFSQKEHKIVYGAGNIGQYDVTVDPVVFSDTGKHWAKKNIDKWSNLGVIQGYAGKFNPNANIRRGDMALIVSRITGEDPVKLDREKEYMTRQDAAVLIGQSFGINPSASSNTAFSDAAGISAEARPYMYSLANKGYMKGYNGKINPTGLITRAEAVTMFGNMVETIVNYGTCTKNVKGNLLINGPDTVLKGITVDGDVYITDGVGDGEVTLDETRVTGNIYVRGGGVNSIKLKEGTQVGNVYLKRTTGALRLVSEHENTAKQVVVMDGEDQVVLTGAMANVDIKGSVSVKLKDLSLKNLTVNVANAKLNADSTTHVENATLEQVADKSSFDISGEVKNIAVIGKGCLIEGSGAVDFVNIQGNDTTVKTNGTNLKVAEGVTGAIGGKDSVAAGTTATTPGKKPTISSSGKVSESVSPYAPSIKTSINDGDTYKNSRLSMHMVASDTKGNKLSATAITVTLNGTEVKKDWDDIEKTTYTLNLQEGKNTVVIEATDQGETTKKTYEITYKPKGDGTAGTLYMDIELFTLGGDFLISPMSVDIMEGENGAQLLTRILEEHGFTYKYTGKIDNGFYLAHIIGGDVEKAPVSGSSIPKYLQKALDDSGYDIEDREDPRSLGEFDFTSGSGWMYSVNDDFPNVGFADYYPQDGDVMRIQFTLAIGADIGGAKFYGGGFWDTENKDDIIKKYADKEVPSSVLEKLKKLNK